MKKKLLLLLALAVVAICSTFAFAACNDNKKNSEQAKPNHIHSFDEWQITKVATCTEEGEKVRYCSCGEKQTESIILLNHDMHYHQAKAATCTEVGWNAYQTCSRCDYSTYQEIQPLSHNYKEVLTNPTCTERGFTTHTCSSCKESYVDSYTDALTHNYMEAVTKPTCTERGFTTHTCSNCNDSYTDSYINALGHDYETQTIPATCAFNGATFYECKKCDYTYQTEIKAEGHSGNTYCSKCGLNFYDQLALQIQEQGSLSSSEYNYYVYTIAHKSGSYTYNPQWRYYINDNLIEWIMLIYVNNSLSYILSIELSKATGNFNWKFTDYVSMKGDIASMSGILDKSNISDTTTSITYTTCSSSLNTERLKSTFNSFAVENIKLLLFYSDAFFALNDNPITLYNFGFTKFSLPLLHNYNISSYTLATCDKDGLINYVCSDCTLTKTLKLPALGHNWIVVNETTGNTSYECSVCHKSKTEEKIFNITYDLDGGNATNPSTYTEKTNTFTLSEPTKDGYTFIGWTGTGIEEMTKEVIIEVGSHEDKNFIAHWKVNSYTITYDTNGGSVSNATQTVVYGSNFELVEPERTGYTFNGWYNENTKFESGKWLYTNNIILVANWTANNDTPYKINVFLQNLNDDDYTFYESLSFNGMSDAKIIPNIIHEGFTPLPNQYVDIFPDGSQIADFFLTRNYYTVRFFTNSEFDLSSTDNNSLSNTINAKYGTELPIPIRTDYTFGGWFKDINLINNAGNTVPANNITLYAWWTEENKPQDFSYSGESSVTISKYNNSNITSVVPKYIGGNAVQTISNSAFKNNDKITNVIIPDSVNTIEAHAFSGCSNLKSINIPDNIVLIENYVFNNCTLLVSIIIPDNVTSIGSYAFSGCSSLTSINLPDSLTTVGSNAFSNCSSFSNINIPDSVTRIGSSAFSGCSSLSSVNLSDGLTNIGDYTFSNCSSLTNVIIPENVTYIGSYAFSGCSSLTSINLPNSITTIDNNAFSDCKSLISITIPEEIKSINNNAFRNCLALSEINFNATECNDLNRNNNVFAYAGQNGDGITVNIGLSVKKIPAYLFYASDDLSVPNILNLCFAEGSLCEIIGAGAFYKCSKLVLVTIPDNVTNIGESAFKNCASITDITLPNKIISIGALAFQNCSGLVDIAIPESVTTVGGGIFYGCSNLTTALLSSNITSLSTYSNLPYGYCGFFGECRSLTNITIPNTITSIGSYAFEGCTSLKSIIVPDTVTSIGSSAFRECTSLASITLPFVGDGRNTASDEYQYPFGYIFGSNSYAGGISTKQNYYEYYYTSTNNKITSTTYHIPSSLKSVTITSGNILYGAFQNCSGITSITVPDNITSIGDYAFDGCSSLTNIVIPETVAYIGDYAFQNCTSLNNLTIPDNATNIGTYILSGCSNLQTLTTNLNWCKFVLNETTYYSPFGSLFGRSSYFGSVETNQYVITASGSGRSYKYYLPSSLQCVTVTGQKITDYCFYNCSIQEIVLSDNTTIISKCAFEFSSIKSIIIPKNVSSIGLNAFNNCSSLTIYCKAESKPSDWNNNWHCGCPVVWGYKTED